MPHSISGIGTMYIGRWDLREYPGTCSNCGERVHLRDYQTRLWLSLFVPVVPLGRRHIVSFCPACTSHASLSPAKWEQFGRDLIRDTRERLTEEPHNADHAMGLLCALSEFGRDDEAGALAEQISRTFADDPEILCLLALWFAQEGRVDRAEAVYSRVLAIRPTDRAATLGLAVLDLDNDRPDRARERIRSLGDDAEPIDPNLMISLASAYQDRGDHEAAIEVFREVLDEHPEAGGHDGFRKLVRTSEKEMGIRPGMLPRRRVPPKRYLAAALAALLPAGLLIGDHYAATHRTLYLANGVTDPVTVAIGDAEPITVLPYKHAAITLAEGEHTAEITLADGTTHAQDFTLEGVFIKRIFSRPTCVLNLLGTAAILAETVWYSADPASTRKPTGRLHAGEGLLVLRGVDYPFRERPASIQTDRSRDACRTSVNIIPGRPAMMLMWGATANLATADVLLDYGESHLRLAPGDDDLVRSYLNVAALFGRLPRARGFLAVRLDDRPLRLHWHRSYQQAAANTGQAEQAVGLYTRMLQADPNNPQLLYLLSRLTAYDSEALDLIQRAIEADSADALAWEARACHLQNQGRFAEAEQAAREAVRLDPENWEAEITLNSILLALGRHDELVDQSRDALAAGPTSWLAHNLLLRALVLRGDVQAAAEAHERYVSATRNDPMHRALSSTLLLHDLLGEYEVKGSWPIVPSRRC